MRARLFPGEVGIGAVFSIIALLACSMSMPTTAAAQSQPVMTVPSAALSNLQDISTNFYKAGAYAEALEFAEKVMVLTLAEFGPDHERSAIQTYSLGLIAEAAGRLDDAARHYRESARIRDKVYGVDSAGTAQALERLGGVLLRSGKLADAESLFQRVLKIRGDLVGHQHSFTASAEELSGGAWTLSRGDATSNEPTAGADDCPDSDRR